MAGIYIHIPFCKKLCHYCDFYHVISHDDKQAFIDALGREISFRSDYLGADPVNTLYFGGGTPSVLTPQELSQVLGMIRGTFRVESGSEITIEVNPDDITPGYLKEIRETGINRISMGVQSWNDKILHMLNRRHTAAQAEEALDNIFNAGFTNVTVDLIYGIPGLSSAEWKKSLEKTFSKPIVHLSAYHLSIEPGTVFGKMKDKGLLAEIDEEESAAQFSILTEMASAAGFIHYEISNFGKEGFFSVHNTNYWKQVPYLGLGPSAHSFNRYSRQWNLSDVKKYTRYAGTEKAEGGREELDLKTRFNEYIMTSLRTMWGIDLDYTEQNFEKEGYDYVVNIASKYISYGMMRQEKNTLVLTDQGIMISDNIISGFMMPEDKS